MAQRKTIPVHTLSKVNKLGIYIREFTHIDPAAVANIAHRDENYIFMLMQRGRAQLMVDFNTIQASGRSVFCILPGQVHYGMGVYNVKAWIVGVDADLVHKQYRQVFEQELPQLLPVPVSKITAGRMDHCITLLNGVYAAEDSTVFQQQATRSLLDALLAMFADVYAAALPEAGNTQPRTVVITRQFKGLLSSRYKTMKSPAAYAAGLNISVTYLNEVVKAVTGLPVSYWIQQEIVMEAKRLLYYTDSTVKEIAYELGYDDHAYFSRLFNKAVGMPALTFRRQYRE